ncbi:hypothetical protein TRICI_005385 [Trichomonascus ciferrii]|uniref:NADP-dependent oxidoreductase domain-containing protein n=1 Tax=Trichomonascus ciferrii TaxID=44093 RepID=A0A642USS9_9ASCO|nr:hypothetical protein TRICI_005385 [Trichomonascus ciferrii]
MSKTAVNIVFGTMTFGEKGIEGVRTSDPKEAQAILDTFKKHGHRDLDSARIYGNGTTEELLGELNWEDQGFEMHTKLYPTKSKNLKIFSLQYTHEPEDVRRATMDSLKALGTKKVDLLYLHGPDRTVPFEDTVREVNKLHEEGYFNRFGLSNFMSWEVAQICEICKKNGWIMPTVYQGIYNALHRAIEPELIPCLRHYGIALYCFQPLAGGFLTSRYKRNMSEQDYEPGSRFDPKRMQGQLHHGRYMNDVYLDALDIIREVAKKHNLTEIECAFRWLSHHSQLSREKGDSIIIGASSVEQLEKNLAELEKGPLPEEMVQALDNAYLKVNGVVPKYFH